ncbi:MAG: MauE/DoxX family redox-associated membrane protein [Desulfuromonadales bacterium]|nr:MauE/DoxX family redox-associated membrane protein [Desulfuromonadales bacterium]
MNRPIIPVLTFLLRWTLGGLFLWAGAVKLSAPKAFSRSIDGFGLVPEPLLPAVAIGLPLLEILIGLAVIRRWRFGLPAMAALLMLFIAVLGYAVMENLDVDCGCFSVAEQRAHTSARTALWRDLLLLAGVALLGGLGHSDRKHRKQHLNAERRRRREQGL